MMAGIASYGDAGIGYGYVTILLLWLRQTKWFNGPCTTYGSEVQTPPLKLGCLKCSNVHTTLSCLIHQKYFPFQLFSDPMFPVLLKLMPL